MKKILFISGLLLVASTGFAQVATNPDSLQKKIMELEQQILNLQKQMDAQNTQMTLIMEQKSNELSLLSQQLTDLDKDIDTTIIKIGNMTIDLNDMNMKDDLNLKHCDPEDKDKHELKKFETKWGGIDLGMNGFMINNKVGTPAGYHDLELVHVPLVVNLHVLRSQVNMFKGHLNLNAGVFFEINNYKFTGDNMMVAKIDSVTFIENGTLKKNKLTCTYVHLPLMMEIQSNPSHPEKSFRLGLGGSIGYLVGAHTKVVTPDGTKTKIHDDFNLNNVRYGLTGRIGFGNLNFFVNYSMSNFFRDEVKPQMHAISVGVALIGFNN